MFNSSVITSSHLQWTVFFASFSLVVSGTLVIVLNGCIRSEQMDRKLTSRANHRFTFFHTDGCDQCILSKFTVLTRREVLDLSLVSRQDIMITRLSRRGNSKEVDWALKRPWFVSSKTSLDVALSSFLRDSNDKGSPSVFTRILMPLAYPG